MRIRLCIKPFTRKINFSKRLIKTKCVKRLLRNALIAFATFMFLLWRSNKQAYLMEEKVVTVDKNTWNFFIGHKKTRNPIKSFQAYNNEVLGNVTGPHLSPLKNFPLKSSIKKTISSTLKVPLNKKEWLFQLLKQPINIKKDSFTSRDSSYSAIKDGVRKPLEGEPVILVWWPPEYLLKTKKGNLLEREFQGVCGKCRLTTDRSTLTTANVVLFDNIPTKSNLEDLPPKDSRRPEQAYILWHRETPSKTFHLKNNMQGYFDKMFNYTLSYRRDSDIYWYLGNAEFVRRSIPLAYRKNPDQLVEKIITSKRHLAVWVVSNCNNTKGAVARTAYVSKLEEAGLKLNKFGRCFGKDVQRKGFDNFLLPYKFYLAFENSWHCKDYLTEKFWKNSLMFNLVPIVWGPSRQDVADVAPPHSFIHSEDFETPQALVEYLNYLDNNDAAYREYFKWRLEPVFSDIPINMIRNGYEPAMCKICRVLNENRGLLPYKTLPSAIDWVFIDGDDSKCLQYDLK